MTKEINQVQINNSVQKVKAIINIIHNNIYNKNETEILLSIKENFILNNKRELGALIIATIEDIPNFPEYEKTYSDLITLMIEDLNNLIKVSN